MLNQLKAGLKVAPEERVGKPDELKKYEQMKALGLPIWAGGIQDQPHIWLAEFGVIDNIVKLIKITQSSSAQEQPKEGQHGDNN